MAFYKAICWKNNQKVELIIQFDSIIEAREFLHKEGYNVIDLFETWEYFTTWWVIYFDDIYNWKIRTGQINWNDGFKAYVQLVDVLKLNIKYVYYNKDADEKEKILNTQRLLNSYLIYKESNKDKKKEEIIE